MRTIRSTTVPHGDIDGVYRTLVLSHFSRQFLEGEVQHLSAHVPVPAAPGRPARKPLSRHEQRRAFDWAEQRVASRRARYFREARAASTATEVTKTAGAAGLPAMEGGAGEAHRNPGCRAQRFDHGEPSRRPNASPATRALEPLEDQQRRADARHCGLPHVSQRRRRQGEAAVGLPHVPPVPPPRIAGSSMPPRMPNPKRIPARGRFAGQGRFS